MTAKHYELRRLAFKQDRAVSDIVREMIGEKLQQKNAHEARSPASRKRAAS